MRHPFLGDDIEDMLRKLNVEAARNPVRVETPLPAGWCRCGDAVCRCGVIGGRANLSLGRNSWSTSPQFRTRVAHDGAQFFGLEDNWCRGGLPGGIAALRAALVPDSDAAPVTVQTVSVPATGQAQAPRATPWIGYLCLVLWKRGLWKP